MTGLYNEKDKATHRGRMFINLVVTQLLRDRALIIYAPCVHLTVPAFGMEHGVVRTKHLIFCDYFEKSLICAQRHKTYQGASSSRVSAICCGSLRHLVHLSHCTQLSVLKSFATPLAATAPFVWAGSDS